jgi:hypothetical protein
MTPWRGFVPKAAPADVVHLDPTGRFAHRPHRPRSALRPAEVLRRRRARRSSSRRGRHNQRRPSSRLQGPDAVREAQVVRPPRMRPAGFKVRSIGGRYPRALLKLRRGARSPLPCRRGRARPAPGRERRVVRPSGACDLLAPDGGRDHVKRHTTTSDQRQDRVRACSAAFDGMRSENWTTRDRDTACRDRRRTFPPVTPTTPIPRRSPSVWDRARCRQHPPTGPGKGPGQRRYWLHCYLWAAPGPEINNG